MTAQEAALLEMQKGLATKMQALVAEALAGTDASPTTMTLEGGPLRPRAPALVYLYARRAAVHLCVRHVSCRD